jgi:hypothetical protein
MRFIQNKYNVFKEPGGVFVDIGSVSHCNDVIKMVGNRKRGIDRMLNA